MGHELDSAIETNEKGEIKLDSAGKPVFKDTIEWETDSAQIMALWTCTKALLEERVVPPNEIDAAFDLLTIYAKAHRPTTSKPFKFSLPVNYFVGTWHILNSCRMFHIFKDDKRMDEAVDGLTLWFAQRIDMYHEVKRKETMEEKCNPKDILSLPKKSNSDYYKPIDKVSPKEITDANKS